ncbi:Serine/threonine-protein phosphatase 7 long form [Glycine max]|nr:Serine/threonine-protein phosphatase 7 long form [Glycine max]
MKLAQLKVNGALVNAFIERWRPKTYTFHLKCGETTITLQDVSVLLGIPVDGRPLIGNTNIDWFELCHELLGVMPDDAAVDGNSLLLSWLTSHFANIHDFTGNQEGLERFARAWILRFIGGVMFVDKSSKRVPMRYLQFLRDLRECSSYAWGAAVLGGELHHIGNDNLLEFRRKLDVMKCDEGEIAETLHFMVSPVGRKICTFDDLLPCIEKITLLSDEEDKILEAHEDAPPSQPQFEHQQFNILQQSVETRGLARRQETVDAATYSLLPMPERQHGIFTDIFGSSPPSTGTPSFTQSGQLSTPNASLASLWNVPGDIPDMDDLLGVDLRHDFSAEADQVDERANRRRRNPNRAARNWDRPCGTSSRHHRHSDD